MSISLFEYDDYKSLLWSRIQALPNKGYGFKSRMAEATECKTSYVAQVLHGKAHFSLEQADRLCSLLQFRDDESDFFLLLVQLARAGTPSLRKRIQAQIEELRAKQLNLKQRFAVQTELNEKDATEFFSRWYIPAVHLGATIPRLKNREQLAHALTLNPDLLREALDFLIAHGLLEERKGVLEPGPTKIFIGRDSPIMKMHHANWRTRAIESLDRNSTKDLHFTSVYSLSAKDAKIIRERLINEIEAVRGIVRPSPEEQLAVFTLDFFRIDRE